MTWSPAVRVGLACALSAFVTSAAFAQTPPPPRPKPFPGATQPATPATPPADQVAGETIGDAPIYPTAEFLESFDAGQGQTYYLYGSNSDYETIVGYYRNILRDGGRELFKTPATRQFDLGRYDDNNMAFPPSIVVKDYTWNNSPGYVFVEGTTEKRFRTIIQIVPVSGR